jgi:ribosomal-protein-alanine N-acetyltransferase
METPSSPRLIYRFLTPDDVSDEYVRWLNDPEVNRYLETRFTGQTLETCRDFVLRMNDDPGQHLFGMFESETNRHIGNIKLGFINPHHRKGQLSLFIGSKEFHGRGFATEAVTEITRWGFAVCDLLKIEAGCYDSNMASLSTFLKCGYSVEGYSRSSLDSGGRRRGGFLLGITAEDARPREQASLHPHRARSGDRLK